MGYTKNTWEKNDIITAGRLNNMETGIDGFYNPIELDTGYDFNNLKIAGYYMGSGIFPNSPMPKVSSNYHIEVYASSRGFITQRVTQYTGDETTVYLRSFVNNWQPWQQLTTSSSFMSLTGDQTVAGDKLFTGKTTIASKEMTDSGWLNIPLDGGSSAVYAKYRILFGVVHVHVQQISGKSALTPYFTLPDGIRPPDIIFQTWFSGGKFGNNQLQPDGKFMCVSGGSDTSTQVSFYTQYPI